MAMPNPKNFGLTPAATDLGLGDAVKQQLEDQEAERKKKLLQLGKMDAFGGSPASMSLLGPAGGGMGG